MALLLVVSKKYTRLSPYLKNLIRFLISIVVLPFGTLEAQNTPNADKHVVLVEEVRTQDCIKLSAQSFETKSVAVRGSSKGCIELSASDYIDLIGNFDSEFGSNFNAEIVTSLPDDYIPQRFTVNNVTTPPSTGVNPGQNNDTSTPPPPPVLPKNDGSEESGACESLANHGPANPHVYAITSNSTLYGDVIAASTPEFKIEGLTDWKKMYKMSKVGSSDNLHHFLFSEGTDAKPRKVWLRTKAGCTEYPDIRTQQPMSETLNEWALKTYTLPSMQGQTLGINFFVNSELEGKRSTDRIAVYNIFGETWAPGYRLRINGSEVLAFSKYDYEMFRIRPNRHLMTTPVFFAEKDFILDVSNNGFVSGERYTVYRNYQGGHWSTVTVLTRHDGRVTASVQGINWEVNQRLVNNTNGQVYTTIDHFGNNFDLGFLHEGDHSFSLQTLEGFTVNPNIVVKVKKPTL